MEKVKKGQAIYIFFCYVVASKVCAGAAVHQKGNTVRVRRFEENCNVICGWVGGCCGSDEQNVSNRIRALRVCVVL